MTTMPAQKPGTSEQTVRTPFTFLDAVGQRFGRLEFDLAATQENAVGPGPFFGPGSPLAEDALASGVAWPRDKLCWCNPPYGLIKPGKGLRHGFASMARYQAELGTRLVMLIPASVATNWFADYVHGHALVMPIRPRLTFVGHTDPYPKDLMLCAYNLGAPGFEPWNWLTQATIAEAA